jgi:hypothetical protein
MEFKSPPITPLRSTLLEWEDDDEESIWDAELAARWPKPVKSQPITQEPLMIVKPGRILARAA